jgi:UDP-glucuronate decarboxylase
VTGMVFVAQGLCDNPPPSDTWRHRLRRLDITLGKQPLDWEPSIQLEQWLIKTIAHFDELLKKRGQAHIRR